MRIRKAREEDAEAACVVLRRSISELCTADHRGDAATLGQWLSNKTPTHFMRWAGDPKSRVLVADEGRPILAVGAIRDTGHVTLNYVSPDARFCGVSKAMMAALEQHARKLGLAACTLDSTSTARDFYREIGYREAGPPTPGFGVSLCYPMVKTLGPQRVV